MSRGAGGLAAALLLLTAALAVGVALTGTDARPVVALLGGPPRTIATLQVAVGALVPLLLVAVVAGLRATGRLRRSATVWALGAAAPILLVLVARLNGAADAAVLVLVYAASAGGVVLRSLQRPDGDPVPIRWSAVLGIVPWGVVAFSQVGGLLAGSPPPPTIRMLTVVVLAASVLEYVVAYRRRGVGDAGGSTSAIALVALPGLLLAAGVVLLSG